MTLSIVQKITIAILPLLFAITLHEAAHGYMALLCGDKTAKLSGRLSLNPINHLDIVGTLIVPIISLALGGILFGWAKPVPVNERNLKNPKRDIILVALSGPTANLLMAFAWAAVTRLTLTLTGSPPTSGPFFALNLMGQFGIMINLFIMLFNLLPIPPLDGSRILSAILSPRLAYRYEKIAPYGIFILLALILVGALNYIIGVPYSFFQNMINSLFGLL
jgi:Zn-dependent protease